MKEGVVFACFEFSARLYTLFMVLCQPPSSPSTTHTKSFPYFREMFYDELRKKLSHLVDP